MARRLARINRARSPTPDVNGDSQDAIALDSDNQAEEVEGVEEVEDEDLEEVENEIENEIEGEIELELENDNRNRRSRSKVEEVVKPPAKRGRPRKEAKNKNGKAKEKPSGETKEKPSGQAKEKSKQGRAAKRSTRSKVAETEVPQDLFVSPVVESENETADQSEEFHDAEEHISSEDEIAIVLVDDFPDQRKFLRTRKNQSHEVPVKRAKLKQLKQEDKEAETSFEVFLDGNDDDFKEPEKALESEDSGPRSGSESVMEIEEVDASSKVPSDYQSPEIPEVIEVESDAEEAPVAPRSNNTSKLRSTIRLLYNPSYSLGDILPEQEVNLDTVTIEELVGTKDLVETVQFNFNVDLEYFLSFLHPDFSDKKRKITFITGGLILATHPLRKLISEKFNIAEYLALLPNKFASHHLKMMINFYEKDEVEIVIMTSNLTQLDFGGLTQAIWRSGRLRKGKTKSTLGKRFRLDLIRYLARYKLRFTDLILKRIESLNFSSVDVELVASVPGTYSLEELKPVTESYGYVKLRQILERNHLLLDEETNHNVLAQVTSIAYPYLNSKGHTSLVFTHLLCPLLFGKWKKLLAPGSESSRAHQEEFNYTPHIVFPTAREIASSNFGFLSGSAVHFKYTTSMIHKQQYEQNVKPYLYKWSGESQTGREKVTPHVKYYACDNGDGWKTLKWVLVGSHNLSKQAWGYPVARLLGSTYVVDSYELSVFKSGGGESLVPVYGSDYLLDGEEGVPVRFPFSIPPVKYGKADQPWSAEVDFGTLKDRWGNHFKGGFSV